MTLIAAVVQPLGHVHCVLSLAGRSSSDSAISRADRNASAMESIWFAGRTITAIAVSRLVSNSSIQSKILPTAEPTTKVGSLLHHLVSLRMS